MGATWGAGVRRAPQVTTWGWNQAVVAKVQAPTLMVSGVHDRQVSPELVKEHHADLGSCHVGAEPSAAVSGIARMAHTERGEGELGRMIKLGY